MPSFLKRFVPATILGCVAMILSAAPARDARIAAGEILYLKGVRASGAPVKGTVRLFASREVEPRKRPAYDDASLAQALRLGIDPAGRQLDPLMPRYVLDDEDVRHLAAYLHTLSAAPSPGVGESTLIFATVVTEGVPPRSVRPCWTF